MAKKIKITIHRYDPTRRGKHYKETYKVPFEHGMRVLGALKYIQEEEDPTLAFRWNCRAGACGSCAAEVNGKAVLTCKTEISEAQQEVEIAPMKVFAPIKDLVVNFEPMWKDSKELKLWLKPKSQKKFLKLLPEQYEAIKDLRKCIECFICHDVCHVIRDHQKNYIGPRFVVKAVALDKHPKDTFKKRYKLLEEKGIWYCNVSRCCQMNCPEKIRITDDAIIFSKERSVDDKSFLKKGG